MEYVAPRKRFSRYIKFSAYQSPVISKATTIKHIHFISCSQRLDEFLRIDEFLILCWLNIVSHNFPDILSFKGFYVHSPNFRILLIVKVQYKSFQQYSMSSTDRPKLSSYTLDTNLLIQNNFFQNFKNNIHTQEINSNISILLLIYQRVMGCISFYYRYIHVYKLLTPALQLYSETFDDDLAKSRFWTLRDDLSIDFMHFWMI